MDMKEAVTALGALAHASRLAIFRHLVELGPEGAFPGDLIQKFDFPPATVSFHLKTLAHAGLIEAEQQGRYIRYRANFSEMQDLVDYLTQNCCGGDPSKCAPTANALPAEVAIPVKSIRVR